VASVRGRVGEVLGWSNIDIYGKCEVAGAARDIIGLCSRTGRGRKGLCKGSVRYFDTPVGELRVVCL
jgi:hypothetical protein